MVKKSDPMGGFEGGGRHLEELLSRKGLGQAMNLLESMGALQAQELIQGVRSEFGQIADITKKLSAAVEVRRPLIERQLAAFRKLADPEYDRPFHTPFDAEEYEILHFMQSTAGALCQHFESCYKGLFEICEMYKRYVAPVFSEGSLQTLGDLKVLAEAMRQIIHRTTAQLNEAILKFEPTVSGIYLLIQQQHAELRRKYQLALDEEEKAKDPEDFLLKLISKMAGKKEKTRKGPNIELIDDNCFLTETLLDIAENLPRYRVTVADDKKTGGKRTIRRLDDYDVEYAATALTRIANPHSVALLNDPRKFMEAMASAVEQFYAHYNDFEPHLKEILQATRNLETVTVMISGDAWEKRMADPSSMVRKMRSLNFLSILPPPEETEPRTKVEKDYAEARRELLHHLKNSLEALATIPYKQEERREKEAGVAVRRAVELKERVDDIVKTEHERRLRLNILEENEFYVGRTGEVGMFLAERAPAPKIRMEEVIGASFEKAKEHIREVMDLAAYPQVLRATAPRGTIKSNMLLIGPYGCGKTELARAVAGDKGVIGFYVSVADALTAYMHESVKNVKRIWDAAKKLRQESRETKPVALILDEFDAWFADNQGYFRHGDVQQMQRTLQETMDGLVDYEGIFVFALTNKPGVIPSAILRRFKYVDIVGQLTKEERMYLFERFLSKGMTLGQDIGVSDYSRWADRLDHAPGDVLGKIADDVHFKLLRAYIRAHPDEVREMQQYLDKIERERELGPEEYKIVKEKLATFRLVARTDIDAAVEEMLKQPAVLKEINAAKKVYAEAQKILDGMVGVDDMDASMGFTRKGRSRLFTPD